MYVLGLVQSIRIEMGVQGTSVIRVVMYFHLKFYMHLLNQAFVKVMQVRRYNITSRQVYTQGLQPGPMDIHSWERTVQVQTACTPRLHACCTEEALCIVRRQPIISREVVHRTSIPQATLQSYSTHHSDQHSSLRIPTTTCICTMQLWRFAPEPSKAMRAPQLHLGLPSQTGNT